MNMKISQPKYTIIDKRTNSEIGPSYVYLNKEIEVVDLITFYYYLLYPNLDFKGESHNYYEIFVCMSGKAKVVNGSEEIVLNEGDFILHKPNVFHIHSPYKSYLGSVSIGFSATGIDNDLICGKVGKLNDRQLNIINMMINEYINNFDVQSEYPAPYVKNIDIKNEFGYKQMIKGGLENLLVLATREFLNDKTGSNVNYSKVKKEEENPIVQYIKEHYKEKISLEDLSNKFNYSVGHLCHIFKRETGQTIVEYITNYRVSVSMRLLFEKKELPIEYIAFEVGFNDVQYFTKSFKKCVGMSPGKYRFEVAKTNAIHAQDVAFDVIKNIK